MSSDPNAEVTAQRIVSQIQKLVSFASLTILIFLGVFVCCYWSIYHRDECQDLIWLYILDQPFGAKYTIVAETGDAWFSSLKLRLPNGNAHEVQMSVCTSI